ncbi:MAG TPA: LuxR C-terminal-related transcriptional regulator [Pseudonocardiaceae bacterium]|jgi:DNA-binding NarL/FixJ family response regulator|nr:LuxR C-terminal-related transcriptional regulator [Pseudonocardiaceae bacterium]
MSVLEATHQPPYLSAQDVALLALLAEGLPIDAVGRRLQLSGRTVRRRTRSICEQLGVQAPVQAIVWAARRGLV